MPTKDELAAEVEQLRQQNGELRDQLDARPATPGRPAPTAPSFGMCEGTRAELDQVERATDPFTGRAVTRADLA